MAVKINPKKLRGQWREGYALDVQTTSATFLGYNAFGHPEFDTTRSPLGELVYQRKYRGNRTGLTEIVDTVAGFLRDWKIEVDALVPVPPSNTGRKSQPVVELARAISERTGIALRDGCVKKVKNTGQLKDVFEFVKRAAILKNAFAAERKLTEGMRLLLFDDLYRSGATAAAVTQTLMDEGGAATVVFLALTRTRSKL